MTESVAREATSGAVRVSTLELFFDLVFVFTVTQLTTVFANDATPFGLARVSLMMLIIGWMYLGYVWLTNAVAPNTRFRRTLVLVGMGSFLAIALSIPDAFGATGWLFGLGYFVVNIVHSGLFLAAGGPGAARAMARLAPLNLTSASLVLAGGVLTGPWRLGLWIAAAALILISPYLNPVNEFTISPGHFVERHGLIIIVALGESIVAIGVGAIGLPVDLRLVAVAVLGLSLSYLMYWVYFGEDNGEAEEALAAVDPSRRGGVALAAFGWAHFVLLLGIVVVSAGVKKAVGHAFDHLTLAQAVSIAGGLSIYLIGDAVFRRILRIGVTRFRVAAAVLALATIPLGLTYAAAQLGALILLLIAMLYTEARAEPTAALPG